MMKSKKSLKDVYLGGLRKKEQSEAEAKDSNLPSPDEYIYDGIEDISDWRKFFMTPSTKKVEDNGDIDEDLLPPEKWVHL